MVSQNKLGRYIDNFVLSLISAVKNSCTLEGANRSKSRFRKIVRKLLLPLARLIGTQRLNKFETFVRSKNNVGKIGYTYGTKYLKLPPYRLRDEMLMPINIFYHYSNITFENRTFKTIKDFHTYLLATYGDYMKLPPKDKQFPHHHIVEFQTSITNKL